MKKLIRILIVEDLESDAEILKRIIASEGIKFEDLIVDTKEDYVNAISVFKPDLILSDFSLPQFDGMKALLLRQELAPDIPFILVTGSMNEEVAVDCMKAGADDYVIKQNIIRLIPAIRGAILKQETIRLKRESEESLLKLKKAVNNSGEVIFLTDKDGIFTFVNPAFTSVYGYSDDEIIGKVSPRILKSGLVEANAYKLFWETLVSGKEVKGELINKRKDNTLINIESSSTPIFDEKKNIIGFLGIQRDITDRKLAEDAIRKERILLRTLIDNLPDTIYSKDIQGRKILANLADLKVIGCSSESEILGKTDLEIFPGEIGQRGHSDDTKVLQSGEPVFNKEEDFIDGNGNHRWLHTSKIPLFDEHGVVTGLVGIGHDITTRKKAEEELRKLSQAVEQSPVSIIITDVDGVIEYVNPTFSELTGYTRQEAIGENPRILKSETTPKEMYTQLWNTIKSGREWHGEFQNKKKNGEIYFESALISPIFDQKGSITHFLASKEDITNRKIAEEVIRQKVEELAISNEELTRFNRLAIGREMRMIDIKKYCNHLAAQLGIEQPYRLAFLEENNNIVVDGNVVSSENNDKMK